VDDSVSVEAFVLRILMMIGLLVGLSFAAGNKQMLPLFNIQDVDGEVVSSKDFKGKVLVVDFWATWCLSCKKVIPVLNELQSKYDDKSFAAIGINTDKKRRNKIIGYMIKNNIEYPTLLAGKNSRIAEELEVFSYPSVYVFNKTGELVLKVEGFEDDDKKALLATVKRLMK
jgi:cytochrome c biogenesis protein CcmG, thiol:disulfide interchange protein DsbE